MFHPWSGNQLPNGITKTQPSQINKYFFKSITNKDLLNSTWNSAQCYVAAWMGGEFVGRMDTCIYMTESLPCSPETVTTLLISYAPTQNKKFKRKTELLLSPLYLGVRVFVHNHSCIIHTLTNSCSVSGLKFVTLIFFLSLCPDLAIRSLFSW